MDQDDLLAMLPGEDDALASEDPDTSETDEASFDDEDDIDAHEESAEEEE